jgi:hypothetical protein
LVSTTVPLLTEVTAPPASVAVLSTKVVPLTVSAALLE